jgi:hypothetical protein
MVHYDSIFETSGMIAETLNLLPNLVPLWRMCLKHDARAEISNSNDGAYQCLLFVTRADIEIIEAFRAASEPAAAIYGAIREAYSALAQRQLPEDLAAIFIARTLTYQPSMPCGAPCRMKTSVVPMVGVCPTTVESLLASSHFEIEPLDTCRAISKRSCDYTVDNVRPPYLIFIGNRDALKSVSRFSRRAFNSCRVCPRACPLGWGIFTLEMH